MKPEHPNFKHLGDKSPVKEQEEVKVHHVLPAEDELKWMKEMNDLAANSSPQSEVVKAPPIDDVVMQKELEKRKALDSLVLFREPTTKVVKISGVEFTLKLLNVHENTEVYKKIRELPNEESLQKSPILLLAAALVSANGLALENNYSGPTEVTDPIMRKYYELCNWNMSIINTLVDAYTDFVKEVEEGYKQDFFPKPQKTPSTD